jgi:hypothetical protein
MFMQVCRKVVESEDGHARTEVPDAGGYGYAGPGDAAHLGNTLRSVGEEPNHELGEHRVELVVFKRQVLGRSNAHVDVGQARTARVDRVRVGIDGDHTLGADELRGRLGECAGAAAHIKRALPGSDVGDCEQLMSQAAAVAADGSS